MSDFYGFDIDQIVENDIFGTIKIIDRWRGMDVNFYDIMIIDDDHRYGWTWTLEEDNVVHGDLPGAMSRRLPCGCMKIVKWDDNLGKYGIEYRGLHPLTCEANMK